jgi:phosphotransferase system enzyme I (PtsI)
VTPHGIPEIKKIIRSITLADAKKVAARVQRLDTAGDITNYLRNRTRHIVPELIDDLG